MSHTLQVVSDNEEIFLEKNSDTGIDFEQKLKIYKVRWFVLFLFVILCISNVMHVSHYTILADIIVKYYGVSYTAVNWSFTIYLLVYIIFGFPATWILEKWGIRVTVLIIMALTAIGAWIKVGSTSPEHYWIALVGQSIIAMSQTLLMPIPPKLAAVWFPSYQVSSACSIGIIGINMGLAVGFLVPPLFFKYLSSNTNGVGEILYTISLTLSILDTIVLILILMFFKNVHPSPPSLPQLNVKKCERFSKSVKLYMNITNVLLIFAYGIPVGLLLAVSTLLNPLILNHYPNAQVDAGWIGLIMIFGGIAGSITFGVVLDVYGKFKETMLSFSILGIIAAMACFTFAIDNGIEFVYFTSAVFGFSTLAIQVGGFELGAELAYPVPEGIIAGILSVAAQLFGIGFTYVYTYLLESHRDQYANLAMLVLFVIEFILMYSLKYNLRRRAVGKELMHCAAHLKLFSTRTQ